MAYLNISLSPMSKRVCVCVYTYIPGLSENLNGRSVSTKLVSLECMVAWKDFSASIYQCQLLAFIYPFVVRIWRLFIGGGIIRGIRHWDSFFFHRFYQWCAVENWILEIWDGKRVVLVHSILWIWFVRKL